MLASMQNKFTIQTRLSRKYSDLIIFILLHYLHTDLCTIYIEKVDFFLFKLRKCLYLPPYLYHTPIFNSSPLQSVVLPKQTKKHIHDCVQSGNLFGCHDIASLLFSSLS